MATNAASARQTGATLPNSAALPADGFSRWATLKNFVPLCRETVRQREAAGRFPKRQQLGSDRCTAWPNREVHRWLADPDGYRVEG